MKVILKEHTFTTLLNVIMTCWEVGDKSSLPDGANIIGTKWVFKVTYENGDNETHRARIVALRYRQCKDVDSFETFNPTSSYVGCLLLLLSHFGIYLISTRFVHLFLHPGLFETR